jgi:hypothetical protein
VRRVKIGYFFRGKNVASEPSSLSSVGIFSERFFWAIVAAVVS